MSASARDCIAVMRAVPAISARWAAILPPESARLRPRKGQCRREERLLSWIFPQNAGRGVWEMPSPRFSPLPPKSPQAIYRISCYDDKLKREGGVSKKEFAQILSRMGYNPVNEIKNAKAIAIYAVLGQ